MLDLDNDYNLMLLCIYYDIYLDSRLVRLSVIENVMSSKTMSVNKEYTKRYIMNDQIINDDTSIISNLIKVHSKEDVLFEIALRKTENV